MTESAEQGRSWWWRHATLVVGAPVLVCVGAWMIVRDGDLMPSHPSVFWNAAVMLSFVVSGLVALSYLVAGRWTPDDDERSSASSAT